MFSGLHTLYGCTYDDDQVPRLLIFRAEHPDWEVFYMFGLWRAVRLLEEHIRVRLDHLLDLLEGLEAETSRGDLGDMEGGEVEDPG